MGRRNKNTFSKALGHLKSRNIDEKLQMLSERPVNSTAGYMTINPSTPNADFVSTERGQENNVVINPDLTIGDNPSNGTESYDTSGLFLEDGTILTATPPGDNSYILGPMSAMWYAWANQTRIGYIRQADRKMVNLGYITGRLGAWDGNVGAFNSYGQLTLEQAEWFRTIGKRDGADNNTENFRAFYPGPPSNPADSFGRYLATIVGEGVVGDGGLSGVGEPPVNPGTSGEQDSDSTFSAIMARLKAGKKLSKEEEEFLRNQGLDDFVDGGNTQSPLGELALLGLSLAAAKAMVYAFGAMGPAFAKLMANEWGKRTLSDAAYKAFLKTGKMPPGIQGWRPFKAFSLKLLKTGPTAGARRAIEAMFYSIISKFSSSQKKQYESEINEYKKKLGITEDPEDSPTSGTPDSDGIIRNPGQPQVSGTLATSKVDLDIVNIELRLSGDAATNVNRPQSEINADKQELRKLQQRKEKMADKLKELNARRAKGEYVDPAEYKNLEGDLVAGAGGSPGQPYTPPKEDPNNPYVPAPGKDTKIAATYGGKKDPWDKILNDINKAGENLKNNSKPGDPDYMAPGRGMGDRWKVKNDKKKPVSMVASYQRQGRVLSESRKGDIIRDLKNPVVIPETKQKSYKVKPKIRTLKTVVSKPVATPEEYKPPMKMWGRYEYNQNVRASQERKNEVMNLLGEGEAAMQYRLKNGTTRSEQEMKKFWGKHPELYDFYFNNMSHRMLRKEQVNGDCVVFLVDEKGKKMSMHQSELNEKLAEAEDQKLLDEYNKLNPQSEPISYEKDPLFKKVSSKLKPVINYPKKPAVKGYPDKAPPKLVNGFHPDLGKRYKYDKLDPQSAEAMPPQGNPEIDANIEKFTDKNAKIRKIKNLIGKKS